MDDRLTFHVGGTDLKMLNYGLDAIWRKKLKRDRYDVILRAVDRLAAYEDLGTVEELAALKEQTRWIPVNERLPEDVGSYLIYYHEWSNGDFLPKYDDYRIRVMRFMNNGKWCMPACTVKRCEADTNREVTHWMPLPPAPKGE